jgi:ferredoxin-NADP reductase/fatty acid desaturase
MTKLDAGEALANDGVHGKSQPPPMLCLPDPDLVSPVVAIPTLLVWLGSLAAWTAATATVVTGSSPAWLAITIPVQAFVTFSMFTVVHESVHHSTGRAVWVNEFFGRVAMPFVSLFGTFPMMRYIHIEHHSNTNEHPDCDPDAWNYAGARWQIPLRWTTIDAWYCRFYLSRFPARPRRERIGFATNLVVVFLLLGVTGRLGYVHDVLLIYVIPQRIGLGILAWWFDWLPHHDLSGTAKLDRFRATRIRVGWERLLNPLLFYQNYHFVHHIHPAIPFYRYIEAWKKGECYYLDRNVPITTAWGRTLSPSQYRAWRNVMPRWERNRFYRLRLAEVSRLTAQSVLLGFRIPDELTDAFRFEPGQHVTVKTAIDGREVQRNYSICTPAGSRVLGIAVKEQPGGRFSSHANRRLSAGDELEVMPPSGRFTLRPAADTGSRHIAALAAGSGISPIMSILASALTSEPHTRATLLYANRDRQSTMFGPELSALARKSDGRLRITHYLSCDRSGALPGAPRHEQILPGRLIARRLAEVLRSDSEGLATADDWYLCGPGQLTSEAKRTLIAAGVRAESIHSETFHSINPTGRLTTAGLAPATVRVTLHNAKIQVSTAGGESVLEAALRAGIHPPYSCIGGVCGTCRALIHCGDVHMESNRALTPDDIAGGWILTCQARPTTETIDVDYDSLMLRLPVRVE